MTFANHVTIGPEFFAKAFNDYSSWRWAIVREFMQNSMDCKSGAIRASVALVGGDTVLTVENDGDPMTREIIVGKLLALGGSGKNFQGTVGGFGKAKEILYFAHKSYKIETGGLIVSGSGAGYNIDETSDYFSGTRSTVVISGDQVERLTSAFRNFAAYAQWDGEFYFNGDLLSTDLRKGAPRRDLGFGMVYTNKSFPNKLILRINGVPMYHEYISLNRCVIVELKGASVDVLTSNRDGLNNSCRYELSSFITELAVDKRSALKNRGMTRYRRYEGKKLRHRVQNAVNVKALVVGGETAKDRATAALVNLVGRTDLVPTTTGGGAISMGGTEIRTVEVVGECAPYAGDIRQTVEEDVIFHKTNVNEEFIIKNETDLQIPAYYLPDSQEFSTYSQKLVRIWGRLLVELHRLFDHEADFALGFIFDETAEAEFENFDYGKVYYLNPAKVVEQSSSNSKSFKKRFQLTERNRLLMIALHEFVHGLGLGPHDEDYANRLTDMAWKVLDERKRFNWCFVA